METKSDADSAPEGPNKLSDMMDGEKEETKFQMESSDGYTTPIRIWFATYTKRIGKLCVNEREGELVTPSDIEKFDDIWHKLTLYLWEKADHQFTMERVDKLSKMLAEKAGDLNPYFKMCDKMIDWLRIKSFFAGDIVCKHFKLAEDIYCQFRDDANDPDLPKTFLEAPTLEQFFGLPPKYRSLSKDKSKISTEEDIKKIVDELYKEASSLVSDHNPCEEVEEYKFQMLYQMILKDLSIINYRIDFNDIKQQICKLKIPLSDFSHCKVKRSPSASASK